jgi:ABC-2 type transport system ATP-binding protein
LNRSIYHIPEIEYKRVRDEFVELLELQDLVHKPVRNLSLGERMKVEIVGALLHRPQVLFLDEPTIGLDVTMQRRLREFIAEYNRRCGATVLLTSHYMADVQALCKRVIVIHHGRILFDGGWKSLVDRFSEYKTIVITLAEPLSEPCADLARYGEVTASDSGTVTLRVPKAETRRTIARLLTELPVDDLTIQDAPIEHVIERVFAQQLPEETAP